MKLEQLSDVVSFTIGKNPTRIKGINFVFVRRFRK